MKMTIRRTVLASALVLATAPALAQQMFSQTVFFGDSLTDSGHFRPAIVGLIGPSGASLGRFTTNPNLVWAEQLAGYYGTEAVSDNQGGNNYAVGGARVGVDTVDGLGPIASLATQTNNYLASTGGVADANALYTVWGGANDLFAVLAGADPVTTIGGAVTAQVSIVGQLQAAGARYVLVPTVPDLGVTPFGLSLGPAGSAGATALSNNYNSSLFGGLNAAGLRVIPLDTYNFLHEIIADPATYGLSNVTGVACLTQPPPAGSSSLFCNPASYVSPDAPNTYAFADGVHPSAASHQLLMQFAVSILEAPRQIAVLPHSEAMVGRARADRVSARASNKPDGDGTRWWTDVRGDFQRFDRGDAYDGAGPTLSFGVDWARGDLVYGAFGGYGRQQIDFGLRKGEFEQTDLTLGGLVGWHGDHAWATGQLSYSRQSYDVDRDIQLGPATRTHSGSPDGDNLSAGVSGGWNFSHGKLQHGPVLAVLAQRIEVDGYAENSTESTALAYPDQSFDSLIASAGWQASYTIHNHLKPYARVTIDREFEESADEAFAQSLSMPGTAPFAVPGMDYDRSYSSLTFGAATQILGLDANIGASTTIGQKGGHQSSVFVTLSGGF